MKVLFKKTFLKNKEYAYIEYQHPCTEYGIMKKVVYLNGQDLMPIDKAAMFTSVIADDFFPFMEAVLVQEWFTREHYGVEFGYVPADFGEDNEIPENDVGLTFVYDFTIVSKKVFYELCVFACDARLIAFSDTEIEKEKILNYKSQLQQRMASS